MLRRRPLVGAAAALLWLVAGACAGQAEESAQAPAHAAAKADNALLPPSLVVNEVMHSPHDAKTGEYVELYNPGPAPVALEGLVIDDGDSTDPLVWVAGPEDRAIAPGGYALIVDPDAPTEVLQLDPALPILSTDDRSIGNGLAASDPIKLWTPEGHLVAESPPLGASERGHAFERRAPLAGEWQPVAFGSPGRRNHWAPSDRLRLHVTFPDDAASVQAAFIDFVDSAQRTLDCAMYQVSDPEFIAALIRAHERGVSVQLITDTKYYAKSGYVDGYGALEEAGITVIPDGRDAHMHHKFMVADLERVWLGSMNPTDKSEHPSSDAAIELTHAGLAAELTLEVQEMAAGTFGVSKAPTGQRDHVVDGAWVTLLTSPTDDVMDALVAELGSATTSVHFLTFAMSLDEIGAALLERGAEGVEIRGVFDPVAALRSWSEALPLREAGHHVRVAPHALRVHHKMMVIDGGTDHGTLVVGSYNFTNRAEKTNDESLLIIRDARIAAAAEAAFSAVWAGTADDPWAPLGGHPRLVEVGSGESPWVALENVGAAPLDLGSLTLAGAYAASGLGDAVLAPGESRRVDLAWPGDRMSPFETLTLVDDEGWAREALALEGPGWSGATLQRTSALTWAWGAPVSEAEPDSDSDSDSESDSDSDSDSDSESETDPTS